MSVGQLTIDAVLRIGEVSEVDGRKVYIKVDREKNLSDLFLNGEIINNVATNSYIEIKKGYLSIIGIVEGEKIREDGVSLDKSRDEYKSRISRYLTISLIGYIGRDGSFTTGTKELPLVGNEAYILTKDKILQIHNLVNDNSLSIKIATTDSGGFEIAFPIDGLFNSHIAIFGNTGSGKSNTLAALYQELIKVLDARNSNAFRNSARFLLFDFNGEYASENCLTANKKAYDLSTSKANAEKLPIEENSLLNIEMLSILSSATEKTQKPFLNRTLRLYRHIHEDADNDFVEYFRNMAKKQLKKILAMSEKQRAFVLLDYLKQMLPEAERDEVEDDIEWHNKTNQFTLKRKAEAYFQTNTELYKETNAYELLGELEFETNPLAKFIQFLYLQLIKDVTSNRAQNEHIAPAINKLKGKQSDIEKIFDLSSHQDDFWQENFVVINLNDVNLDMKKTLPLLIAKRIYEDHKNERGKKTLTIIIDEAHNILSRESFREAETWKDYRLETFEEIIKEGRKFGVFVTISSQRPNDISPTITSQAHNYFIHRLINQRDLATISSAVSYIDRVSEESIPTLPTGTCIFSGIASQRPIKINIKELADVEKPKSKTLQFQDIVPTDYAEGF